MSGWERIKATGWREWAVCGLCIGMYLLGVLVGASQ